MSNSEIEQLAQTHFNSGFNCAEAMLMVGTKVLDLKCANMPKVATPFGGGLAGNGYTCGAISGALMTIGLAHGRKNPEEQEQKQETYKLADNLVADFKKQFGSIQCRALTKLNFKTKEDMQKYKESVHAQTCVPIVQFVATWLNENIKQNSKCACKG